MPSLTLEDMMTSTALDRAASYGLTTAHEAVAAARGTPGADAALDAVMRAEDSILAAPLDLATMGLRAGITVKRLRLASEDTDALEWSVLDRAVEDMDDALAECFSAIAELVRVAEEHRAAIQRGGPDPSRGEEAQGIERAITAGRVILRAAGIEAE